MPPRPEGTDGSDHSYRMVIAERYQRMADFKHSLTRLMASHVVVALVKTAWTGIGTIDGHSIPVYQLTILGLEALVVGSFVMAKLGTVRESLALLKTWNILQALAAAAHVLSAWRYHTGLNLEQHLYSRILARELLARRSGFAPDTVIQGVQAAELTLDLTFGTLLVLAVLVAHNMIREKMAAKEEAAAKGAAKRAADAGGGDAPEAVPLAGGSASPERRVAAKASARAKRRIA